MSTFFDSTAGAAEASEALRGLAHASRGSDQPAQLYGVRSTTFAFASCSSNRSSPYRRTRAPSAGAADVPRQFTFQVATRNPMSSPMSSGCLEASPGGRLVVGCEGVVDDACQASFQAAQRFGGRHTLSLLLVVVLLPEAVGEPDLGDRDPVERSIQLPVPRARQPHPPRGPSRPHRNGGDAGVPGELGLGSETGDPAASPTSLAAVSAPQPGRAISDGAATATAAAMRRSKVLTRAVSATTSSSSARANSATMPSTPTSHCRSAC